MSQKKTDNLGQIQPDKDKSNVNYHKGSTVEFWRCHGITSENTTHEKLGQSTLMFTNRTKTPVKDDSLEASIRYLKFKRFNLKTKFGKWNTKNDFSQLIEKTSK
jgi:hypothetical protein